MSGQSPLSATEQQRTALTCLAALAARADWLTVEWLPEYAPELNDIELEIDPLLPGPTNGIMSCGDCEVSLVLSM